MTQRTIGPHKILYGDSLEVLKAMDDCSVDAVVTDPPYALQFMGKGWDKVLPNTAVWGECLRVLKPGGHLLSFGGTRTFHRLACNIEDAGFELRDTIMWMYGSGFPKSLDVSKAIDKRRAGNDVIRPWLKSLGTREEIAVAAGVTPRQVDHWLGENTPCPQTLTEKRFLKLCEHFGGVPEWAEDMYAKTGPKLGTITHGRSGGNDFAKRPGSKASRRVVDVNDSATEHARQWQGWGTALKPAFEPIIVARKPLIGTVAENVLEHGTGALNIDGCRVGENPGYKYRADKNGTTFHGEQGNRIKQTAAKKGAEFIESTKGRFPANVIHDGSDEVLAEFAKYGDRKGAPLNAKGKGKKGPSKNVNVGGGQINCVYGDSGSAARFFYCAKASKKERTVNGAIENRHPTVKPVALMQYLCRLVTPPSGTVLDPFFGSGTTGVACHNEGFHVIGIDSWDEAYETACKRLEEVCQE